MKISEAAFISGIGYNTLRRHVALGWLEIEGGQIDGSNLYHYCVWQWKRGRVTMYPPDTVYKRLVDLRGIFYEF